jgi:hypothetical protein
MSIYSTIELTPSEAIQLIADHICSEANNPEYLEREKGNDNAILSRILLAITNNDKYSPYHYNNYIVTESPRAGFTLQDWNDENFIS